MLRTLTRPTRGRISLWASLALLWFLFLPQALAMDADHTQVSWFGAVVWAVVLASLLSCLRLTWRRYRSVNHRDRA